MTYRVAGSTIRAVDNVSLTFRPGEMVVVSGPSGGGKTTLLSILGCLLEPDSGRVQIMGEPVIGLSCTKRAALRQRAIGYVFQSFRLFHALNAIENVMIAAEIAGRSRKQVKQDSAKVLDSLTLLEKRNLKPHELSGGEKQRVAIARALVNNPPILLADEPTASLDSDSAAQVTALLARIALEQHKLVIVVTHDTRVMQVSTRALRMKDGRIVEENQEEYRCAC